MYPSFQVFGLTLHFYSIFYLLGLVSSGILFVYGNKRLKQHRDKMLDCYIYIVIGIMLGAKLMFILANLQTYIGDISKLWTDIRTGFLFYGGFIGAVVVVYFYLRKQKLPYLEVIDSAAVAIPLGHAIGRIGCLFAGCCYGSPTDLPWAIVYPDTCPIAPGGVPLHPAPIYEIILLLTLFAVMMFMRNRTKYKGSLMSLYLIGYSIERFVLEYFRDDYNTVSMNLTLAQITSIALFAVAIVYFFIIKAVNKKIASKQDSTQQEALPKIEVEDDTTLKTPETKDADKAAESKEE
jgi:phosphatidylglycerol---prolipoprotein diacylglyceryl transferase